MPRTSLSESTDRKLVVGWVNLGAEGAAPRLAGGVGRCEEAAKRLPDYITRIAAGLNNHSHEIQWLLVEVSRPTRGGCFDSLGPVHGRAIPNVCDSVGAVELGSHSRPFLAGAGTMTVE